MERPRIIRRMENGTVISETPIEGWEPPKQLTKKAKKTQTEQEKLEAKLKREAKKLRMTEEELSFTQGYGRKPLGSDGRREHFVRSEPPINSTAHNQVEISPLWRKDTVVHSTRPFFNHETGTREPTPPPYCRPDRRAIYHRDYGEGRDI